MVSFFFLFLMNKQAKYIKHKKNATKASLKYTGSILRDQKRKGSQKRPPAQIIIYTPPSKFKKKKSNKYMFLSQLYTLDHNHKLQHQLEITTRKSKFHHKKNQKQKTSYHKPQTNNYFNKNHSRLRSEDT